MTNDEYYNLPTTQQQIKNSAYFYKGNVKAKKANNELLACENCDKIVSEYDYVNYQGYCGHCFFKINNTPSIVNGLS